MPIPDYQACMMPLLMKVSDGETHELKNVVDALAEEFELTPDERVQTVPSGRSGLFKNRVSWARSYLKKAGLIEYPSRAMLRITEEGRRVAHSGLARIDREYLTRYPSFQRFIAQNEDTDRLSGSLVSPDDLDYFLSDFCDIAADWLTRHSTLFDYHQFIQNFFQPENLEKIEWADIQRLGNHIDSLQTDEVARIGAFENPIYPIAQYRDSFKRLAHGEGSVEDRMRWFLTSDAATNKYLGAGPIGELMGQLHADTHLFYNHRSKEAALFLGIDFGFTRADDEARHFAKFNEAIRPVFDAYREILGPREDDTTGLEVYLFLCWLFEKKELGQVSPKEEYTFSPGQRVWEFAPGRDAFYWEAFYKEGIAALGWDEIGDLRQYQAREDITEALKREYDLAGEPRNDSLALWQWVNEMKPGDIILAKKGRGVIVGQGIVDGEYEHRPDRSYYHHVRRIRWEEKGEWRLPKGMNLNVKTLTDLTPHPGRVKKLTALIANVDPPEEGHKYWWLNRNPSVWDLANTPVGHREKYYSHSADGKKRRIFKYFDSVAEGDQIVGYLTSPIRQVTSLLKVIKILGQGEGFECEVMEHFTMPPRLEDLRADERLAGCEPLKSIQGSLFSLTEEEFMTIMDLVKGGDSEPEPEVYAIDDALEDLFMDSEAFQLILDRLENKKNVILQGPPGVGKTFVAKRIAYTLMGEKDHARVRMVQFHQSYSYEDFVRGYRPTDDGGFSLRDGIFHQFCLRARQDDRPYIFVIDEINRGNISKILGELMMLIEHDKRNPKYAVPLAYQRDGEADFYVPGNVYIIGLMNTADRSLAMVDYALRRRFAFIDLAPAFGTTQLSQMLAGLCGDSLGRRITEAFRELNSKIAADVTNLGPGFCIGHSYFCLDETALLDGPGYRQIVDTEIAPLLREYWFDQPGTAEGWIARLLEIAG